jgi:midasin
MDLSTITSSLPEEIVEILRDKSTRHCLGYLSHHLLDHHQTDSVFPSLEPLLPDLVSRWLSLDQVACVIAAFGRIIPFQPHLSVLPRIFLRRHELNREIWTSWSEESLLEFLLGLYRLALADSEILLLSLKPMDLLFGLNHDSRPVRYLTIRLLGLFLHTSDAMYSNLIQKYIGDGPIYGLCGNKRIDYRFFSLWEYHRYEDIKLCLDGVRGENTEDNNLPDAMITEQYLLRDKDIEQSIIVAGMLLPTQVEHPSNHLVSHIGSPTDFIETKTTKSNLKKFITSILDQRPILLYGQSGSGKSAMVNHLAKKLNKFDSMITLHLNEQSDAKVLLGLHTTTTTPGKFTWKPGVLTTAVQEGRWVLVEDLDRAPNEIIGTLLPLIERRELILPGRGETVKAAPEFKLIATIRTSTGQERDLDTKNIIGMRFWNTVAVNLPNKDELADIISIQFPEIPQAKSFVQMYQEIRETMTSRQYITQGQNGAIRYPSSRDLFKWCRRISKLFRLGRMLTDEEYDILLLEATDCFAGHLYHDKYFEDISALIAKYLNIDSRRKDYILRTRQIKLVGLEARSKAIQIGRVVMPLPSTGRKRLTLSKTFSMNPHTLRILERISSAVKNKEPLLLVGETGTGKTTSVQQLASLMGKRLVPFNLSQQSEGSDLLGGFKPVNIRGLAMAIQEEFEQLFWLSFSQKENIQFIELLSKCLAKGQWKRACKLWTGAVAEVEKKTQHSHGDSTDNHPREVKRQKTGTDTEKGTSSALNNSHIRSRWLKISQEIQDLESRLKTSSNAFAFTFVEGSIVKAVRNGDWILLDEINLAPPDTLEALFDLLQGAEDRGVPSLLLTESGKVERIVAHTDFRVFAAMNPATDIGKRDLPLGIRSRFTEIYVDSPDRDIQSLQHIVQTYLGDSIVDKFTISQVSKLHLKVQELSESNGLVDGTGQRPHFSLRTLTRCLTFAKDVAPLCNVKRGLYEGFNMSYMTYLDRPSEEALAPIVLEHIFGKKTNIKAELNKALRKPSDGRIYIQYQNFWLRQGPCTPQEQSQYIITPFVQRNLDNLIRATFSRRYPILIQGPTSSGKTSMVEYLAKFSGHKFVRVNNHEHTDLQEYLGSYVSDSNGQLRFQEGILVEALRHGYWIVLDELNLAPSDILEALNRLLDDNRELFIPETQETIKPHEDFMLFATQNPAGLYGGRKPLSRAFRNRFLELHFDDIPVEELCEILQRRTQIPESWSRRIVDVYKELSALRQENRIFEQHSFATLRDLFRWAFRKADTVEELAINGYMLLAERVRKTEERHQVKELIETIMSRRGPKVRINVDHLYSEEKSSEIRLFKSQSTIQKVVWTKSMRRLFVLVAHALRNNEPVLLIGETGCGKTTVCQMLADAFNKELHIVNAHQNTETGDLIGLQRPIRNRAAVEQDLRIALRHIFGNEISDFENQSTEDLLQQYDQLQSTNSLSMDSGVIQEIQTLRSRLSALFEWSDGSLVAAMRTGQYFLLDEISLADDSVLERLNSVLEPDRTVFLAEKGPVDALVTATDGFQFLATMNPGGDYGKRELSPALRNRFTEIWVPSILDLQDVMQIVRAKLINSRVHLTDPIVGFADWFTKSYTTGAPSAISVRDVLACVDFVNLSGYLTDSAGLLHSLATVFIDTLGANPADLTSIDSSSLFTERQKCVSKVGNLINTSVEGDYAASSLMKLSDQVLTIGEFSLKRNSAHTQDSEFTFLAPTTRINTMRIIRALQLPKPILIEGDPGVGKTTLVSTLAKLVGKNLVRMNLSEQTDLMDLFGFDAPVDGGQAGYFAWRDAPFLKALKEGDWVLLDEMNLASQSVLEGLNACLDHRGEAYIAELNQTFHRHPNFRLFAAQNPHHQGGGRKGLPASFVNRFTVVYADPFGQEDLNIICQQLYPSVDDHLIAQLTAFVSQLDLAVRRKHTIGASGSPWEINLRDTLKWLQLSDSKTELLSSANPYNLCEIIFRRRFRSADDSKAIDQLFQTVFDANPQSYSLFHTLTPNLYQVGLALLPRSNGMISVSAPAVKLSQSHLSILEAMIICVEQKWPVILVGSTGSGKSTLINHLAALRGANLVTLPINADTDAMDLVGGYDQIDPFRSCQEYSLSLLHYVRGRVIDALETADLHTAIDGMECFAHLTNPSRPIKSSAVIDIKTFLQNRLGQGTDDGAQRFLKDIELLSTDISTSEAAKFEWVDGILIKALEKGDWLVLDNANLCGASVLDRLNSLLEPNGILSINEHPLPNGETRVITPHPDFRVFLTMDPRYGELSNAMRNRSLELFVPHNAPCGLQYNPAVTVTDSVLYRFIGFTEALKTLPSSNDGLAYDLMASIDHLSTHDSILLPCLKQQLSEGLLPRINHDVLSYLGHQQIFYQDKTNWWTDCFNSIHGELNLSLTDNRQALMVSGFQ